MKAGIKEFKSSVKDYKGQNYPIKVWSLIRALRNVELDNLMETAIASATSLKIEMKVVVLIHVMIIRIGMMKNG